jgi:hypothetical protein
MNHPITSLRRPALLLGLLLLWPSLAAAQLQGVAETLDRFGETVAVGDFDGDGYSDLAVGVPNENVGDLPDAGAVNVIYGGPGAGLTTVDDQIWHQDSPGVNGAAAPEDHFGFSLAAGDFDNDGYDDLAIGAEGDDIGAIDGAGAVNVLYGSNAGLATAGGQYWQQNSSGVLDTAEAYDSFGWSVVAGDFDNDGYDDLAIGVAGEDVGTPAVSAGAVSVLYGSAGIGLTADGDQIWHQGSPGVIGEPEYLDRFGWTLAAGDFDGDGSDDLAIGVMTETHQSVYAMHEGAVNVLYGSAGIGLTADGDQIWHQGSPGVIGEPEDSDHFGHALAVGDFDSDGYDDLAVGVPQEDVGAVEDAGAVNALYGSAGAGLTATGNQIWHQDSPGVLGTAEHPDYFGDALTSGDFDNDGFDDLVVGVPFEHFDVGFSFGAVNVLYGSAGAGLTASGDQLWTQDSSGVLDTAEHPDYFGGALAAGDFDNDELDDVAIGAPQEALGEVDVAGAVQVLYSATGVGLSATGNQFWHQSIPESAPAPIGAEDRPLQGTSLSAASAHGAGAAAAPVLHSAAPNPFTTRTAIGFVLAEPGPVRLAVYDLLGREVAVLAEGTVEAGRHEATLDGRDLPSGTYLVRLTAGAATQTQRVSLVR